MRAWSIRSIGISAAAIALMLAAAAASARTLTVSAARVQNAEVQLRDLRVDLVEQNDAVALQLAAAAFAAPTLALDGRLEWRCEIRRDGDTRTCAGPVRLHGSRGEQGAELEVQLAQERLELVLKHDDARVAVTIPFAAEAAYSASLQRVPAAWLKAPLASRWRNGELRSGVFDASADLYADGRVEATYAAADLGFNSGDGAVAGSGLAASGTLRSASEGKDLHLLADADLRGGRLQLGAVRIELPPTPVVTHLDALQRADGRWDIARFNWNDPDVLSFEASGALEPAQLAPLHSLDVRLQRAVFPLAAQRYARSLLAEQGFGTLTLKGELAGEFALDRNGLQRVALTTAGLDAADGAGHAVRGIRGGIDWAPGGERPAVPLGWKSLQMADWKLPAANSHWQSRGGRLHLVGELRTKLFGGELRLARTVLHPLARDGERLTTQFSARELGYDSADGSLGAAHVAADGEIRVSGPNASPRLQLEANLHGGEALAGAVYVKLPATPIRARVDANWNGALLALHEFDWSDPGTLEFSARGEIAPADARPLRALQVDLHEAKLAPALDRYARSWLASKGYAELTGSGDLSGALHFDADGLQRFAFDTQAVGLRDGAGRFAFDGVDGGVDWEYRGDMPATTLAWRSAELFKIPLGPAKALFESRHGAIVLAQALKVGVFGGELRLEKLSLLPRSPRGERYAGSFAIAGLEMPQISAAFGWPKFPGSLSGGIPELVFSGDTIEFRGGLDLYVFDGHLGVSGLTLERPFGVAPSLGANIHFENFDLEQFTSAFSLGGMSGRLFGTIEGLRLVDWSPVALDAWLRTKDGGRLSYKAVDDITSLGGGGGLSSNVQTMALKVFDTFGYSRFGLRCRLTKEVCLMGGIDPLPDGPVAPDSAADRYTIVEGSGVPRLDIVGHRRRVDWPTLVRRVRESMQGQGPIVK